MSMTKSKAFGALMMARIVCTWVTADINAQAKAAQANSRKTHEAPV